MTYKTFVIANPNARNGQVRKDWGHLERLLQAQLPTMEWAFTEGPNHATLLAREALKDGWEMIVAVGGDGTINEVINGFYEKPNTDIFSIRDGWINRHSILEKTIVNQPILGIVPVGTGGDFRRSVGIMDGVPDAIDRLSNNQLKNCDLGQVSFVRHDGKITSRYFANIASAGLAGDVDKVANNMWKGLGGKASFMLASTRAWLKWKNFEGQVRIDDVEEIDGKFQNMVIGNGGYFGGGMWIAPGAELDNGFFETVLVGDLSRSEAVTLMQKVYSGSHLDMRKVTKHRAKKIALRGKGSRSILLDIDGEQPGRLPALYEIHENAIRIAY